MGNLCTSNFSHNELRLCAYKETNTNVKLDLPEVPQNYYDNNYVIFEFLIDYNK